MRATAIRIIPCLDVRGGRVVKGVRFEDLVDSGDPAELSRRYEAEGADEIAMLDISATIEERSTAVATVERIRKAVSIPLLVGGGIRSCEDAGRLLSAGADRVSVNSAAVADPALVGRLARQFGVQCVVLAVDARRRRQTVAPDRHGAAGAGDGTIAAGAIGSGRAPGIAAPFFEVVVESGRRPTGMDAVSWCAEGAALGAGEILLTSMDRDGTGAGYDIELLGAVTAVCPIPVVASGGAASPGQFLAGIQAGARAVLAAGVFHRGELSIERLKRILADEGVEVRI